jgi:isoquinoline 1-oxidoreductase beta subunit
MANFPSSRSPLTAGPAVPSRRTFLHTAAVAGGGLLIGFAMPSGMKRLAAQEPGAKKSLPKANAFVRIGTDGIITVSIAHSEMGQGIWTTLPMLVNEELGADWSKFKVEHAPAGAEYAHGVRHADDGRLHDVVGV